MSFVKENIFIILGITLLLILICLLSIFQSLSKIGIEPPQYKVAYIVKDYDYRQKLTTHIDPETKKLSVSLQRIKSSKTGHIPIKVKLLIYGTNQKLEEYNLDTSGIKQVKQNEVITISIPESLRDQKFIDNTTSPDGYTFTHSSYRSGGLMTEILGYNRNNRKDTIVKETNKVRLPKTSQWPKTHFIGWVEQ